jgi:hypothetical protein
MMSQLGILANYTGKAGKFTTFAIAARQKNSSAADVRANSRARYVTRGAWKNARRHTL